MSEIIDFDAGYEAGIKYAKEKACELIIEVIGEYEDILKDELKSAAAEAMESEGKLMYSIVDYRRAQSNAVKFTLDWVKSGGHTDFDGERVCLPW